MNVGILVVDSARRRRFISAVVLSWDRKLAA